MVDSMTIYGMVFAKLAIGLLAIILQINLMGKVIWRLHQL